MSRLALGWFSSYISLAGVLQLLAALEALLCMAELDLDLDSDNQSCLRQYCATLSGRKEVTTHEVIYRRHLGYEVLKKRLQST